MELNNIDLQIENDNLKLKLELFKLSKNISSREAF